MTTPPNYLALFGSTTYEPDNALARIVDAIFDPATPSALGGLSALGASYPPQAPFEDWRRAAAWVKTAGHVDAPSAFDEERVWLDRNAKPGEYGCWHAAHIVDDALGGPDVPWNYRALNSYRNLSDGARLGNAMARYRRS